MTRRQGYIAFVLVWLTVVMLVIQAGRGTPNPCRGWERPIEFQGETLCIDLEEDLGFID